MQLSQPDKPDKADKKSSSSATNYSNSAYIECDEDIEYASRPFSQ